ncbi:hypothetical protein JB92DRAFT_2832504 [Gautieria morchelliformis]|nr:hypothetical protein JB92DRAFT_2832504 [Gautieria morchelliformis]
MDPWTKAELEKVAKRLYPHRELNDMFKRFDNAGPTGGAITLNATKGMLNALLDGIDDISYKLCVVRRSDSERCQYIVGPISAFIRHRLLTQLWEWKEQDCVNMIEHFSHVPRAGGMRGLVLESLHQRRFAANIQIEAKPMFRSNNTRSRWHTTFGDFLAKPALGKAQEEALNGGPPPICLSIVPSGSRTYNHSELNIKIEESVYYVPLAANEVAIDSLPVEYSTVVGVNHGLLATLKRFSNLPPPANWHYIFVVPEDCTTFSCPHDVNGFLADHVPDVREDTNNPLCGGDDAEVFVEEGEAEQLAFTDAGRLAWELTLAFPSIISFFMYRWWGVGSVGRGGFGGLG